MDEDRSRNLPVTEQSENSYNKWLTLIGRLRWQAALKKGHVAAFGRVYAELKHVAKAFEIAPLLKPDIRFTMNPTLGEELSDIAPTLQNAAVQVEAELSHTFLAFDA